MPNNIIDVGTVATVLLFTGAEVALSESTIFEILSKFGVVAVLWYWLRDLKTQLKVQLTEFREESSEVRKHYDKILEDKSKDYSDYKDRIDNLLSEVMNKDNNETNNS